MAEQPGQRGEGAMRKLLLAAVAVVGLGGSAAAAAPGVYYCVTERMVGIQPEREVKEGEIIRDIPRNQGQIKPTKERFIVKVSRIDLDNAPWKARCGNPPDYPAGPPIFLSPTDALYCSGLMLREAVLPSEKLGTWTLQPLISVGGVLFSDGRTTTFWIDDGLTYQLSHLHGVDGNYLEEGYCETFEE